MLYIDQIRTGEPLRIPEQLKTEISPFNEYLSIETADKLLKTSRQYEKWLFIRQDDSARAAHIACLVLGRHDYIAGRKPANEAGHRHFDQLTDRLKSEGIHLYKSDQFEHPIFDLKNTVENDPTRSPAVSHPADESKLHRLQSSYARKDCLEFVAGIMEENGIAYYGKKGVVEALIQKAADQNKNHNAYITGEGVTGLLCNSPVSIRVPKDHPESFANVWEKIAPHIKTGALLSFSSQHFGHTGIVDQVDGRWTYFNSSGAVGKPESYKVLAEDLKHEIQSWLKRARRENTFLTITIGNINPELASGFDKSVRVSRAADKPVINLLV